MSAIVVIPARYASTRFPGKPLHPLFDKPLIQHVYEAVLRATLIRDVFVATDSGRICEAVERFGGKAIMTSENHPSGTDRIAEALGKIEERGQGLSGSDVIVNVQGDEPLVRGEMVDDVVRLMDDQRASMGTLAKRISDVIEITDPNVVKVVFDREGFALYFSRSPIPYHRDLFGEGCFRLGAREVRLAELFKHIGVYAYRRDALMRFTNLPPARLEEAEKLEQLRALENGLRIKVKETPYETIGVDTPADLERVKKCLSTSS